MKKVILSLIVAVAALTNVNAQDNRMWVGGTVGLWSSQVHGSDAELSFKVMPEFGFILSDNLGFGISLGAGHTHVADSDYGPSLNFKGANSSVSSVNIYRINPFLRYTFLKGNIGALFIDGGVGYEFQSYNGQNSNVQLLDVGFKPGVAVNVSNRISLIGKFGFLGYEYAYAKEESTKNHRNSFGFDFNMKNVELGVSLKF